MQPVPGLQRHGGPRVKLYFFEVTNTFNWGKFAVGQFEGSEWSYQSVVENDDMGVSTSLLRGRGWSPDHLWVMDLQTGEAALFMAGGNAHADLDRHKIWVCPMFEPFLAWLYKQDLRCLDALPPHVEFTEAEAPSAMQGYRRPGPKLEDPEGTLA